MTYVSFLEIAKVIALQFFFPQTKWKALRPRRAFAR